MHRVNGFCAKYPRYLCQRNRPCVRTTRFLVFSCAEALAVPGIASSQISQWQLGGQTLEWATSDSNRIFIDFASTPGAIQPI